MGRFIGDISLRKSDFAVVVDAEEKRRRKDVNAGYEDGDERCEWETGCQYCCFLSKSRVEATDRVWQ